MPPSSIPDSDTPAWALAALSMPSRESFVDVDGAAIHCIAWGGEKNPPLVLIHGNAGSAEWWRFVAPLLADHYHVIAPDLAGMGDSEHTRHYARERYAQQVMAVADALAPGRPPVIVGHSLGGFVAIMVGTVYGERLAGVVVIDSPPREIESQGPSPFAQINPTPKLYPDRASALARFKVLPEQEVNCGFYLRHVAEHSIKQEASGWRWKFDPAAMAHPRKRDYVEDLLNMVCPVSLMWGALSSRLDDAVRQLCSETFSGVIPMVEIPNARHHVMLDEPLALVAALRTQLANWGCLTREI